MSQKGLGSLLCALFAFVLPLIGIVLAIVAIVLGNKHRKDSDGGLAKAGFIIGIIVLILQILVLPLLLAFGAIMYFGALNPQNFLPDRCTFSPEFGCEEYAFVDGELSFVLINQAGQTITLSEVWIDDQLNAFEVCSETPSTEQEIISGERIEFNSCTLAFADADRVSTDVRVEYQFSGSSLTRQAQGLITVTAQA